MTISMSSATCMCAAAHRCDQFRAIFFACWLMLPLGLSGQALRFEMERELCKAEFPVMHDISGTIDEAALAHKGAELRTYLAGQVVDSGTVCILLQQLMRCELLLERTEDLDSLRAVWAACGCTYDTSGLYLSREARLALLRQVNGRRSVDPLDATYAWGESYMAHPGLIMRAVLSQTSDSSQVWFQAAVDLLYLHGAVWAAADMEQTMAVNLLQMRSQTEAALRAADQAQLRLAGSRETLPLRFFGEALRCVGYRKLGRHVEARAAEARMDTLFGQIRGDELLLYKVGGGINIVALSLANEGRWEDARVWVDRGIGLLRPYQDTTLVPAQYMGSLGPLYLTRGQILTLMQDYDGAMHSLDQLRDMLRGLIDKGERAKLPPAYKMAYMHAMRGYDAMCSLGYGMLYYRMHEFEAAKEQLARAEKHLRGLPHIWLDYVNNMAAVMIESFEYRETLRLLDSTRKQAEKADNRVKHVVMLMNYARIFSVLRRFDEAHRDLDTAISLIQRYNIFALKPESYQRKSYILLQQDSLTAAERYLDSAWTSASAPAPSFTFLQHWLLGMIRLKQGDPTLALTAFQEGIDYVEAYMHPAAQRGATYQVLNEMMRVYDGAMYALLALDREAEALGMYEAARARLLVSDLRRNETTSDLPLALRDSLAQISEQIAGINTERLRIGRDDPGYEDLVLRGHRLEAAYTRLYREAQAALPRTGEVYYPTRITADSIRHLLREDETFVEYAVGPDSAHVFVIDRTGMAVYRLGATPPLIDMVEAYQAYFAQHQLSEPQRAFHEVAAPLYDALIRPLHAQPGLLHERLIVVPDAQLFRIPLHALVSDTAPAAFADYNYLALHHDITYAPSATVFYYDRSRPDTAGDYTGDFLGIGDPIYQPGDEASLPSRGGFLHRRQQRDRLGRLIHAAAELHAAASQFPRERTRIISGADATEPVFRALSADSTLTRYRYLHLATHGWIDEVFPQLGGIIFSRENDSTSEGILQPYEIMGLDIRPDLLVLSACRTGVGRIVRGEGLLSLAQSLRLAGADQFILSLWAIDDAATADFFPAFYAQCRQHDSYAGALRQVQTQFIRTGTSRSNPYYWAPFVYYGH